MQESVYRIVSRALALGFLAFFVGQMLSLPTDILGLVHHAQRVHHFDLPDSVKMEENYWIRYYAFYAVVHSVCAAMYLSLATWLLRSKTGARRFFGLDDFYNESAPSGADTL